MMEVSKIGRIFVCGDLHGSALAIQRILTQIDNPQHDDFIIVCGDAGFEYQEYIMGSAKKKAKKFPGTWIVLRGNHDSRYWKEHANSTSGKWEVFAYQDGEYLREKKYPNIWYLPDEGCIYRLNDYNILFIPGAYSVDKNYRLNNGYPWNPAEQLNVAEKYNLKMIANQWCENGFDIDFVIAHTFPMYVQPLYEDLFMSGIDQSSVDKSMEKWLNQMVMIYENNSNFKHYFGGHFHDDRKLDEYYTMLYHKVVNLADYEKE